MNQAALFDVPATDDTDQRFTTQHFKGWAMEQARVTRIDLDAAACDESHHAPRYYTAADNGLALPWFGVTLFNPPWSDIEPWLEKAWAEFDAAMSAKHGTAELDTIIGILPQGRTHRPWWAEHVEPWRDGRTPSNPDGTPVECGDPLHRYRRLQALRVFFPPFRPKYGHPGNVNAIGVAEPNFGSVVLVWKVHGWGIW